MLPECECIIRKERYLKKKKERKGRYLRRRRRERSPGWPRKRGCGCGATVTAMKGQRVADVRAAWIACLGDGDHTS